MTVKISGIAAIQKKFESLTPKLQRKLLRSAMTKGARIVLKAAQADVPVDTGELKKSGKIKGLAGGRGAGLAAKGGGKAAPVGKRVVFTAPHAHLIEKGRKNAGAQPFLRPAMDANETKVRELVKDDVSKAIAEMK